MREGVQMCKYGSKYIYIYIFQHERHIYIDKRRSYFFVDIRHVEFGERLEEANFVI